VLQLSWLTNILGFSQNVGRYFPEMSADRSDFSEMSADIFRNAISNEGGDVVAVRAWKRNVGRLLKYYHNHTTLEGDGDAQPRKRQRIGSTGSGLNNVACK